MTDSWDALKCPVAHTKAARSLSKTAFLDALKDPVARTGCGQKMRALTIEAVIKTPTSTMVAWNSSFSNPRLVL